MLTTCLYILKMLNSEDFLLVALRGNMNAEVASPVVTHVLSDLRQWKEKEAHTFQSLETMTTGLKC